MKLKDILKNCNYEVLCGDIDTLVCDIFYNSKKVINNSMFVALSGFMVDGHKYIKDAIDNEVKLQNMTLVIENDIISKMTNRTIKEMK